MRVRFSYMHVLTLGMGVGVVLKVIAGYPSEVAAAEAGIAPVRAEAKVEAKPEAKGETAAAAAAPEEKKAEEAKQCVTGPLLQAADDKLRLLEQRENEVSEKERTIEVAERQVQEQMSRLEAMRKKLSETAGLADDKMTKDREELIVRRPSTNLGSRSALVTVLMAAAASC